MAWFLNNPIANLYGPHFLILYGVVIAAVLFVAWIRVLDLDPTRDLDLPEVPKKPDAIEIAYLRGGPNEVIRVVIFDLLRRGHLRVIGKGTTAKVQQASAFPPDAPPSPVEKAVFARLATPCQVASLFLKYGPAFEIEELCESIRWRLHDEQLLSSAEQSRAAAATWIMGALPILGLGGYKFTVALINGHSNVAFLIIMAIFALIALGAACRVPRLTSRGRRYVDRLKIAFQGLETSDRPAIEAGPNPGLLLTAAVLGMAALKGTPYNDTSELFRRSNASGAHCGGDCGAGCGGGGGCGGGCGGCGGCGG